MLNYFTLIVSREESGSLLYGFEEAMLILDISIKWLKSVLDLDPESKIPTALVEHCPKATVSFFWNFWLSRFSFFLVGLLILVFLLSFILGIPTTDLHVNLGTIKRVLALYMNWQF